jgi:hypothetical protein
MKKIIIIVVMLSFMFACEKYTDKTDNRYTARIVAFDLNCSTCILEFPDDYMMVQEEIGESSGNYYEAINLSRGPYEIGQMLRVKIRKADINELTPCITLYPSRNYKKVFVTEFEDFNNLTFNDTIELSCRDCLYDPENQLYICLDSVLNDSRCPSGVYCFWEGNAAVRFKFEELNEKPIFFNLNTHRGFTADTIINGYKFTLIGLSPYPSIEHRIAQSDYKAKLIVKRIK